MAMSTTTWKSYSGLRAAQVAELVLRIIHKDAYLTLTYVHMCLLCLEGNPDTTPILEVTCK